MKKITLGRKLLLALLVVLITGMFLASMGQEKIFSANAWAADEKHERYKYLRDLTEHYLLPGKTREQVYQLLGQPDSVLQENRIVIYIVGRGGFMSSIQLLDLRFSDDTLVQVLIRSD